VQAGSLLTQYQQDDDERRHHQNGQANLGGIHTVREVRVVGQERQFVVAVVVVDGRLNLGIDHVDVVLQ
jgi:hypothetical protein